jgi:hypothetical protein
MPISLAGFLCPKDTNMERITFDQVLEKHPGLDLDLQEAIYHVSNLFPKVSSLPDKRVAYEAQIYLKDHVRGKINTVPGKAKVIEQAVAGLVLVHESRTDAHPEGAEAFIEGENIKGNPFPYEHFKKDHMRWRRDWMDASSKEDGAP